MGILGKIFGRKATDNNVKIGGMEDFMTLIRVYFQAVMAADLHITNLNALPDLRTFKVTLKVPTQQGRLGVGEKAKCKKMLKEMYEMDDQFFKEIDQSINRRCRKIQDVQTYLLQFQAFVQDLMMLTGKLLEHRKALREKFSQTMELSPDNDPKETLSETDRKFIDL